MVVGRRSSSVRCTHCCGTAGRDVMFTIAPAIVSALLLGAFFVLLEAKAKPGELGDPSVWITQELSGKCDILRHPRYPGAAGQAPGGDSYAFQMGECACT